MADSGSQTSLSEWEVTGKKAKSDSCGYGLEWKTSRWINFSLIKIYITKARC